MLDNILEYGLDPLNYIELCSAVNKWNFYKIDMQVNLKISLCFHL